MPLRIYIWSGFNVSNDTNLLVADVRMMHHFHRLAPIKNTDSSNSDEHSCPHSSPPQNSYHHGRLDPNRFRVTGNGQRAMPAMASRKVPASNAMTKTHQLSQHFCTTNDRCARFTGGTISVFFVDSGWNHYHTCVGNVTSLVTDINGRTLAN